MTRRVGAVRSVYGRRVVVKRNHLFILPDAVVTVCQTEAVKGGGRFRPHFAGHVCGQGSVEERPRIFASSNSSSGQFEIQSITIFTEIYIYEPPPLSAPAAGRNVTNDKFLGVRTKTSTDPYGSGYWCSVIDDMKKYEKGGNSEGDLPQQWWPPKSTAYHESIHNQEFRELINKYQRRLSQLIEEAINDELASTSLIVVREVTRSAQNAVMRLTENVKVLLANLSLDDDSEARAYKETFAAIWKPEIDKINDYATKQQWAR